MNNNNIYKNNEPSYMCGDINLVIDYANDASEILESADSDDSADTLYPIICKAIDKLYYIDGTMEYIRGEVEQLREWGHDSVAELKEQHSDELLRIKLEHDEEVKALKADIAKLI